ncbi:MAG: copper homeostasis protein CutC [Lachnospiraceae bacterium]|nr:copper homeostasis protein CutC [Lachnospiraceae bacterium]
MGRYTLECCVDSVESAMAAEEGGADRLELCAALVTGGISPGLALFEQVRECCRLPVRVLLRPRFGDFLYTNYEFAVLRKEAELFREKGAEGIVIGCLQADGSLHMERMKELIQAADGMKITLHRAFDLCADPIAAYEQAGGLGIDTILTSGQKSSCLAGISLLKRLAKLHRENNGPQIMAGAGLTPDAIRQFLADTDITSFHLSAKKTIESSMRYRREDVPMGLPMMSEYHIFRTDSQVVAEARKVLDENG